MKLPTTERSTGTGIRLLVVFVLLGISSSFVEAKLKVCDTCKVYKSGRTKDRTGRKKHRENHARCPTGHLLYDYECTKNNNNFSWKGFIATYETVGSSFRFGAFCKVKNERATARDLTLTAEIACYEPPKGQAVAARTEQNRNGRYVQKATCPTGKFMTGSYCGTTNKSYQNTVKNVETSPLKSFIGNGPNRGIEVESIPKRVSCEWNAAGHAESVVAIAYCSSFNDSKLKINTMEVVSQPFFRESNQNARVRAYCPENKKAVGHVCFSQHSDTRLGYDDTSDERSVECLYLHKGKKEAADTQVFCLDKTANT